MSKLKALLLTQGMHGMISQVEGLAKALNLNYKHQEIKLKKFWKLIPPYLTPASMSVLETQFIFDSKVIISCGRKSVIPSIALKKKYKEKVFTIHIQDPKVSIDKFDLIVCPDHDNLTGNNVIKTTGAIHYLSEKEISKEKNYLQIDKENKKVISFILGGPNKYYNFSDKEIDILFNKIKNIFTRDKYKLVIIPSYRTPSDIIKKAFNSFGHDHKVIKDIDKKTYSKLYSFVGNSPSNIQFYVTNQTDKFLTGSLFFETEPNYDSLFPYIDYIRNDIKKMVDSFRWIYE